MRTLRVIIALIALLEFFSAHGQGKGKDWYQTIGSTCSGYTPLNDGLQTFFSKALPLKPVDANHGFAVSLSPQQIDEFKAKSPYLYEQIDIDATKSNTLKGLFNSAKLEKVPFFFKAIINVLSGYTIPNAFAGASSGALFDYLYEKQDAFAVKIENASLFLADGGALQRRLYVASNSLGDFLVAETSYTINLGKENRATVLFACALPISYLVSQFETLGPYNNKILKPVGNNAWQRWDIEDNKWDASKLRYTYQDKDNYYFEEDEIEYDQVVGVTIHKVSLKGGPWQRKKSNSSSFATSYAKVIAK